MPPSSQVSQSLYLQQPQLTVLPQWLSPYAQTPAQGYKQNLRNVRDTFIKLLFLFSFKRIAQPKIHKRGFNFHWLDLCNTAAKLLPWIPHSERFKQLNSPSRCGGAVQQWDFHHSISNSPLPFSPQTISRLRCTFLIYIWELHFIWDKEQELCQAGGNAQEHKVTKAKDWMRPS